MPHSSFDGVIVTIHIDFHGNWLKLSEIPKLSHSISHSRILLQFAKVSFADRKTVQSRQRFQEDWRILANKSRFSSMFVISSLSQHRRDGKLLSRGEVERENSRGSLRKTAFPGRDSLRRATLRGKPGKTADSHGCKPTKITVIPFFPWFPLNKIPRS